MPSPGVAMTTASTPRQERLSERGSNQGVRHGQTHLEIRSMLAICFWFRMTSMAAHTYWTTLGSACRFFITRDMISLFITTVGNTGDTDQLNQYRFCS